MDKSEIYQLGNLARRTKETLIPKWPIMMLEAWNWVAKAFKGQLDLIVF